MRIWYQDFCAGGSDVPAIVAALQGAGIELTHRDPLGTSGPGIVLFDSATDAICTALRAVTGGGGERVLAIATTAAAFANDRIWKLLGAGAADVFAWHDPVTAARSILARLERWADIDRLMQSPAVHDRLVGHSRSWTATLRHVIEAACFTQAPILITGETGTGKELVARLVHALDRRQDKRDLVVLDCSTLVPQLSGSEFFGHERGAFTSAVAPRDGAFALAHRGTLFLDEVGELAPDMQTQLLRVVQEQTYKRVGSNTGQPTQVRLVCATNRNLQADVAAGRFRADLFFRIAGVACRLPPLRERATDIAALVEHFIKELRGGGAPVAVDEPVMRLLIRREYRGNVRELRLLIMRMLYRHTGPGPLTVGDLPEEERDAVASTAEWRDAGFVAAIGRAVMGGIGLKEIGRAAEQTAEQIALDYERGNVHQAAMRLGVTDRALQLRRATRRATRES